MIRFICLLLFQIFTFDFRKKCLLVQYVMKCLLEIFSILLAQHFVVMFFIISASQHGWIGEIYNFIYG